MEITLKNLTYRVRALASPVSLPDGLAGSLQRGAKLVSVLLPEERKKLLKRFPNAVDCVHPYVNRQLLSRKFPSRFCLWPSECSSEPLKKRLQCLADTGTWKQERISADFCPNPKGSKPLLVMENKLATGMCALQMRVYDGDTVTGEGTYSLSLVSEDEDQDAYFYYGLLSSRMQKAWAESLVVPFYGEINYYKYVYKSFVIPVFTPSLKERIKHTAKNIEGYKSRFPAACLREGSMNPHLEELYRVLNEAVDELYGGPFSSNQERAVRLAELYLQRRGVRGKFAG